MTDPPPFAEELAANFRGIAGRSTRAGVAIRVRRASTTDTKPEATRSTT